MQRVRLEFKELVIPSETVLRVAEESVADPSAPPSADGFARDDKSLFVIWK